jgi:hypothetical protein
MAAPEFVPSTSRRVRRESGIHQLDPPAARPIWFATRWICDDRAAIVGLAAFMAMLLPAGRSARIDPGVRAA